MPLFKTEEEEVMQLQERVAEAQRIAAMVSLHMCDVAASGCFVR